MVIRDSLKVDLNREAENLANGVAAGTPDSQLISPQDVQDAWRAFYGEVESTMKEPGRMAFFRREMDQRAGVTDLMLDPELPKKRALAAQEAFEQAQVNKVRSQVAAGEIPAPQPDKFWADLRKESAKVYRKELEGFKPTLVGYRPDAMFDIYAGNLDEFHNAGADRIFRKLGFEGKGDSSTRIDDLTARAFTNIVVERTTLGRLSDAAAADERAGAPQARPLLEK